MARTLLGFAMALGIACSSGGGEREPAGTPTDPVEVCDRPGAVCRIDGSRLGVCTADMTATCGDGPCYACQPQH